MIVVILIMVFLLLVEEVELVEQEVLQLQTMLVQADQEDRQVILGEPMRVEVEELFETLLVNLDLLDLVDLEVEVLVQHLLD